VKRYLLMLTAALLICGFVVSYANRKESEQIEAVATAATTKTGDCVWVIQDPVVLSEITYTGESILDETEAYINELRDEIIYRFGEDAYAGNPLLYLQLNGCYIALDQVYYPIISNGTIKAILHINEFNDKLTFRIHNDTYTADWRAILQLLKDNPEKEFLYCKLKGTIVLISSDNEIYVYTSREDEDSFARIFDFPEYDTYKDRILSFFDENTNYFEELKNEHILISYASIIEKPQ